MVQAEWFDEPYNRGVKVFCREVNNTREDVAKVVDLQSMISAEEALGVIGNVENVLDYPNMLHKAYNAMRLGEILDKAGKKLRRNDDVDLLPVYGELTSVVANQATGLALLKDIPYQGYEPFVKCGYNPIDTITGNFPSDGPLTVMGTQGVGKSFFGANLMISYLNKHPEKVGGIYTLEMGAEHYCKRTVNMYPEMEKLLSSRVYVSGQVRGIEDLVAEIATKRLDIVLLDDMDGIVPEESPAAYQGVWKRIREICRFIKIPFITLCQPNRAAKIQVANGERWLSPYDTAWSGSGENAAALLLGLMRTNSTDMKTSICSGILDDEDKEFLLFLKSRDGWPLQVGPGIVRLEPNTQMWRGKVWQNRLWSMSGKQVSLKNLKKGNSDDDL
jgi:hypothetical protein